MSPRSPRYPSPASGDDAAPSGRHRRPETLAEVVSPRAPGPGPADEFALTRAALTEPSALYRALSEPTPSGAFPTLTPRSRASRSKTARSETTRSEAARSDRTRSETALSKAPLSEAIRSGEARTSLIGPTAGEASSSVTDAFSDETGSFSGETRAATRRRRAGVGKQRRSRHSSDRPTDRPSDRPSDRASDHPSDRASDRPSGRPGGRSESRRPPAVGSHRAPGTLPVESWLRVGKKRQQILLASLVAAALLVIGIPMRQQGIDAVDAAAARTVGVHIGKSKAKDKESKPANDVAAPAPHTTSPAPKPSPSASAKAPAASVKLPAGDLGPGHSLRVTGSKSIALTFDDGPDPVQTPKILALLAKYQVKATFCLIGSNVQKHPEIVREIVADGHTLCNHTWNHSLTIGKATPAQIQADLARTNAAIRAAVPGAVIPFFRAPGGNFTDRLVGVAKTQGMTSLYWQVDPRDWDHPKGETDPAHVNRVMSEILRSVKPGSIILSHDFNQPDTIAAYTKLMPWLTSKFTTTIPGQPAPSGHLPSTPATVAPSTTAPAAPPAGPDPAGAAKNS